MKPLFLIELNEVNFDLIVKYIDKFPSKFSGFVKLLSCKRISTFAENAYEELEPWIQWASVHTGKAYSEHQIFRLGDIVGSKAPQIFEQLEISGVSVGAISPMNAANRLLSPAYFIPDPWTNTATDGSWWSRHLGAAISQVVNDNAQSKITGKSAFSIILGLICFAKFKHYPLYFKLIFRIFGAPWRKALILDLFLHDVHTALFKSKKPQFSTLFLNAGAHIQHHYFHNSPFISAAAEFANPTWYISPKLDPFLEMMEVYDIILEDCLADDSYEMLVATGLSQCPYDRVKYYYRLKDHEAFLRIIGIKFLQVMPRMTRDFLVTFDSVEEAARASRLLSELRIAGKSEPLFCEIENRGRELFVTLTYSSEIKKNDFIKIGCVNFDLFSQVAFVAIKNGKHQAKGFAFFTSGIAKFSPKDGDHIKCLYSTILNYFLLPAKST
jgi:hypothetical protein